MFLLIVRFIYRYGTIISTKAILDKNTNKCKGKHCFLYKVHNLSLNFFINNTSSIQSFCCLSYKNTSFNKITADIGSNFVSYYTQQDTDSSISSTQDRPKERLRPWHPKIFRLKWRKWVTAPVIDCPLYVCMQVIPSFTTMPLLNITVLIEKVFASLHFLCIVCILTF